MDEAGNFDGNVLQWQLPYGVNRGRNRAGHRVSIIRRYINDVPLDGTQEGSWVSAEKAKLTVDQQTYYGDENDIIVDFRINETLQIGGLGKRKYRSTVW